MHRRTSDAPRARITNYRDLRVWQHAMDLCEEVYRACRRLPRSETFALGDQLRRSVVSVASNIAEGHSSSYTGEYLHALSTARRELAEVETQLTIACKVAYLTPEEARPSLERCEDLSRMLNGLSRKIRERHADEAAPPRSRLAPLRSTRTPSPEPRTPATGGKGPGRARI